MVRAVIPAKVRKLVDEGLRPDAAWFEFFDNVAKILGIAQRHTEVQGSYPVSVTLTGVAASGAITVTEHTRRYPSGDKTVSANSTASGLTYGSTYYVYYDQASRSGGLVSFTTTTTLTDAFASTTNPDRHYVGRVTMPANAGASNTTGTPAYPPGYA